MGVPHALRLHLLRHRADGRLKLPQVALQAVQALHQLRHGLREQGKLAGPLLIVNKLDGALHARSKLAVRRVLEHGVAPHGAAGEALAQYQHLA